MVSAWTRLRAAVDPIARQYNAYTAYTISQAEHVGTYHGPLGEFRRILQHEGYEPQYLSAAKRHPGTNQLHDLSYRKVPDRHPADTITGNWMADIAFDWQPEACQYHVHAFAVEEDVISVYSHYELKPDLWPPNPTRWRIHYTPTPGETYLRRVTDLEL